MKHPEAEKARDPFVCRLARCEAWQQARHGEKARDPFILSATPLFSRRMHKKFRRDGGGVAYRRRSGVECVNSMMKRNLGDTLRGRTRRGREMEMLLKSVVHNTMVLRRRRGSRQSPRDPLSADLHRGTVIPPIAIAPSEAQQPSQLWW